MTESKFEAMQDRSTHLYKMSVEHPHAIDALNDLFSEVAADYFSDFPRNPEEKVAYEVSCYVAHTMRVLTQRISEEIEVGRRLSSENIGEDHDATSDGYSGRRRA